MARVTIANVKLIIDTDLTDPEIQAFIDTAHIIVNEQLASSSCGYSADMLTQIELYLSAHFVTLRDRQLKSEKFGDAKDEYTGEYGTGYRSSQYGQTALILDTCGILATAGNPSAIFDVICSP